jgi:hypothetical protein
MHGFHLLIPSFFICLSVLLHHSWSNLLPSFPVYVDLISHLFFSVRKSPLILTSIKNQSTNLLNPCCTAQVHTPSCWRWFDTDLMPTCIKSHIKKYEEKHIFWKKSYFDLFVLFNICQWPRYATPILLEQGRQGQEAKKKMDPCFTRIQEKGLMRIKLQWFLNLRYWSMGGET